MLQLVEIKQLISEIKSNLSELYFVPNYLEEELEKELIFIQKDIKFWLETQRGFVEYTE